MFRILQPPIFSGSTTIVDGATVKQTAFDKASDWLNEQASAGYELVSPVVVRGHEARCKLDSGDENGALVFVRSKGKP
jgi:hypothetical protein